MLHGNLGFWFLSFLWPCLVYVWRFNVSLLAVINGMRALSIGDGQKWNQVQAWHQTKTCTNFFVLFFDGGGRSLASVTERSTVPVNLGTPFSFMCLEPTYDTALLCLSSRAYSTFMRKYCTIATPCTPPFPNNDMLYFNAYYYILLRSMILIVMTLRLIFAFSCTVSALRPRMGSESTNQIDLSVWYTYRF